MVEVFVGVFEGVLVRVVVGVGVLVGVDDVSVVVKFQVLPVVTALPSSTVTYHSYSVLLPKPGQDILAVELDGRLLFVPII